MWNEHMFHETTEHDSLILNTLTLCVGVNTYICGFSHKKFLKMLWVGDPMWN